MGPTQGAAFTEWAQNRRLLEDAEVRVVVQSVDARHLNLLAGFKLPFEVSTLEGAIWAMPYPDAFSPNAMSPSWHWR